MIWLFAYLVAGFILMSLAVWFEIDHGNIYDSGQFFFAVCCWPAMVLYYFVEYVLIPVFMGFGNVFTKWFKFIRNPNAK